MKKLGVVLSAGILCANMAFADSQADWLQPGLKVVLVPVAGPGSIVMAVTKDRHLFFCGAEPDANNHTPIPGQCNVVISKPGFTFPIEEFMKGQSGWKTNAKIFFKAVGGITMVGAGSFGSLVSGIPAWGIAGAQGAGAVFAPTPIQSIKDQAELTNSVAGALTFSQERDCGLPDVPVANTYDNMKSNLIAKIKDVSKDMIKQAKKKKDPGETFAMDAHQYISHANANGAGPQNEEDEVAEIMTEINALHTQNIDAPAIAKNNCKYPAIPAPAPASDKDVADSKSTAVSTSAGKDAQGDSAAPAAPKPANPGSDTENKADKTDSGIGA